jgi:hypothetical protein
MMRQMQAFLISQSSRENLLTNTCDLSEIEAMMTVRTIQGSKRLKFRIHRDRLYIKTHLFRSTAWTWPVQNYFWKCESVDIQQDSGQRIRLTDTNLNHKTIGLLTVLGSSNALGDAMCVGYRSAVVGANLCVPGPMKVKDRRIRGVGEAAHEEVNTARAINVISQRQYSVVGCLSSWVVNVFGLHSTIEVLVSIMYLDYIVQ